jgi:hypothetical protein
LVCQITKGTAQKIIETRAVQNHNCTHFTVGWLCNVCNWYLQSVWWRAWSQVEIFSHLYLNGYNYSMLLCTQCAIYSCAKTLWSTVFVSVRPSVCMHETTLELLGWTIIKFGTGEFYKNRWAISAFIWVRHITAMLLEDLHVFLECNSLIIYQSKKCFIQKFYRKMKQS